ncbi:MAG: tRNA (adenosine(37)-N6)-threonylcarbamoyltransferase complex ATPase subunit type 1 TsaE [Spirochaetales bacterium]|jgi:tRNA threonylcarbamoyladenosine biosynthesis protein TsaE|nr:tRNA (adenosine(37)-N6)-threonylcarbamoyltransferase complex ATPase subunit type 1 TsaE [Spirochaetales bacterium]
MRDLGKKLGRELCGGEVILLRGPLGAGKTVFVKGLAEGLDIGGTITSPTFTLINVYQGRLPLFHMDFYRLRDPQEAEFLGLEEYFASGGVSAVEWPDAALELIPPGALEVCLSLLPDQGRQVEVRQAAL